MTITIALNVNEDSNPFTTYRWNVDFSTDSGGIVVNVTPDKFPVTIVGDGSPYWFIGLRWTVSFDPPLTDPTLSGKPIGALLSDGDVVLGSELGDRIAMTDASEKVYGSSGDDILIGRGGDDHLIGGGEDDRLIGGPGNDILSSASAFVFDAALGPDNVDHLTNFGGRSWGEFIELDRDTFGSLKQLGGLKKKFLDIGNGKADEPNDFLVYHRKSGSLFYDADGSRKKIDPVLFAILDNKPKDLSHKDFVIFDDA